MAKVQYIAGGATQNSIRVAQWMLQLPQQDLALAAFWAKSALFAQISMQPTITRRLTSRSRPTERLLPVPRSSTVLDFSSLSPLPPSSLRHGRQPRTATSTA